MVDLMGAQRLRPSAVLIGVRNDSDANVIFTRRHDHLAQHAGQVALPGGGVEATDADPVTTALREANEEIGLDGDQVTPLGYLPCFETVSGYVVTPVLARVACTASLQANQDEVAAVFEVPLGFFLNPDNLIRYTLTWHGKQRAMAEFNHGGYRIWGATAAMLCNLLERMGETWIHQHR